MILAGDCIEVMRGMDAESVDSVVTDPPYAIGFMGKEWDTIGDTGRGARARTERAEEVTPTGQGHSTSAGPYLAAGVDSLRSAGKPFQRWCQEWAVEALRILKPGGHLLAFGGTRTYHRLACALEDAGFEIRDSITWIYGSGFPKSMDVSKAIDKAAGAERTEVVGTRGLHRYADGSPGGNAMKDDGGIRQDFDAVNELRAPATPEAQQWEGWGTALKPAHEPIVVGRKPLSGTVAKNVLEYGTGALNIDASRIGPGGHLKWAQPRDMGFHGGTDAGTVEATENPQGRWPANVILSHHEDCSDEEGCIQGCPIAELDAQSGNRKSGGKVKGHESSTTGQNGIYGHWDRVENRPYNDEGGASRFFYQAKASKKDRNHGLPSTIKNTHPTVKPIALMAYLVRMVTPPGGTILDPFVGSGTTGIAAEDEGFDFIGIERDPEYFKIAKWRLLSCRRLRTVAV